MKLFRCALSLKVLSLKVMMLLFLPQTVMAKPISHYSPPLLLAESRHDAKLLELTNIERRQEGLAPLCYSAALGEAAQRHAEDMVANNFFSHTGFNGSDVGDRVRGAGYVYAAAGENLAAGSPNPAGAIRQWMGSPGHRGNILESDYTDIGFGYVEAPRSRYGHYWVQVFGRARGKTTESQNCGETTAPTARETPQVTGNVLNWSQQGQLDAQDKTFDGGIPYDRYSFEGVAGQQVEISLSSTDFDAYVMLVNPVTQLFVDNDDANDNTSDARLSFTLPESGTYWIVASTYNPTGRGRYTLTATVR